MADVEVRTLSPDDWAVWRDVRLRALAGAPEAFGSTLVAWADADAARWRTRLETVPFNVVAFVAGAAAGQASGTALDAAGRAELISMWVDPSARGRGVGDALITAVKDYARGAGAEVLRLSVRRANAPAIRLYERNGFTPSEEAGDEPSEMAMHSALSGAG